MKQCYIEKLLGNTLKKKVKQFGKGIYWEYIGNILGIYQARCTASLDMFLIYCLFRRRIRFYHQYYVIRPRRKFGGNSEEIRRNMYKPHYKALYERQKQANKLVVQAFIILVVLLALVLIGSFIRAEQELISPLPAHAQTSISTERVEIVELLPSPLPMSKRLKECIRNHPDVLPLIKEYFPNEWNEMAELLCRESSFNTQAVNPSSGACGLFQALPCTKMGCELTDTHCQFDWGSNYIKKRYGTATEALFFHSKFNWY